jgi:outer membrane protein assembly factor BamB
MKFVWQKRNGFIVALWPILTLFAGCSQNGTGPTTVWPMYQYRSNHNAVFATPAWNVSWKASLDGKINGGLSIVDSTLYVENFAYFINAFDATTGALKWKSRIGYTAMNAPIVGDGLAIVGTGESSVLHDAPYTPVLGRTEGDTIQAFSITAMGIFMHSTSARVSCYGVFP